MIKKQTLKTKKYNRLAYDAQSNFITDGNFAINTDYLNFDNDLITHKVIKKQSFMKNSDGINDTDHAPKINAIIDHDTIQKSYIAINTALMQPYFEGSKKQVKQYFELNNGTYSTIDIRLLDLLPDDIDLHIYAKNNLSAHYFVTNNNKIVALLMPLRFDGNSYLKDVV